MIPWTHEARWRCEAVGLARATFYRRRGGPPPGPAAPRDRRPPRQEHRHGALGLMTPHDIHYGLAEAKQQQRAELLHRAYHAHPERFPRGGPIPPPLPTAAWINKPPAAPALALPQGAGS